MSDAKIHSPPPMSLGEHEARLWAVETLVAEMAAYTLNEATLKDIQARNISHSDRAKKHMEYLDDLIALTLTKQTRHRGG